MWEDLRGEIGGLFGRLATCIDIAESGLTCHLTDEGRNEYFRCYGKERYRSDPAYRKEQAARGRLNYLRKRQREAMAREVGLADDANRNSETPGTP